MQPSDADARSHWFRTAAKVAVPLLVGLVVLGANVSAASAHSAMLTASASCPDPSAPNSYGVDYTATSWSGGPTGEHPHIQVQYSVNNGPYVAGADFGFPNQENPPSVTGAFTVTAQSTITSLSVRLVGIGTWTSGATEQGPWDETKLSLPKDCRPPSGKPDASAQLVCAAGGAVVTLLNAAPPGGQSVTFVVTAPAGTSPAFSQTVGPVGPGQTPTVTVPFAEGETRTITVSAPGLETKSFTFTRDCEQPAAVVSHECAASGLDVTVENVGGDAGLFSINGSSQSVPAGGSFTVNVAVAEGASVQVTVLMDGSPVAGSPFTFTRDCEQPAAVVSHECAASGLDVTVENVGGDAGLFSINGSSQSVPAGGSFTVNVAVAEGASVQVTVLMDGSPVAGSPFTFTRDCEQPAAVVSHECAASGLDVTVENVGGDAGLFSINGSSQSVPAGGSFTVNVAVAEGASVQVTVLMDGSPVAGSPFTFTRDCEQPAASAASNCTVRGADVTLVNPGDSPASLDVAKNGVAIETVVVPAHGSVLRSYPLGEDEVVVFRVTGPSYDSGDLVVVHDCVQVSAPPILIVATPNPPGELAFTGAATLPLALTGVLLVLAGVLAVIGSRRRDTMTT